MTENNEQEPIRQDEIRVGSFGSIKCRVKLQDVYSARDRGFDLGDLDGLAKMVAVDNTVAFRMAFELWQAKLGAIDVGWNEWCGLADDDPTFIAEASDALRAWLVIFFPAIQAIRDEFNQALRPDPGKP